ncbi:MAG: hypothetical protein ABIR70_21185 [Bryobacteraceae bacterium]
MIAFLILPAAWIWHGWRDSTPAAPTYTVASGEKTYSHGVNTRFGYTVKRYLGRTSGFNIEIWADPSLRMSFDVGAFELTRVKTQRWLAHDRAVLLEFDYIYHDSGDNPGELALLYDFEHGELHSFGHGSAWFVWPPEHQDRRQLSRTEFDQLVMRLSSLDTQQ